MALVVVGGHSRSVGKTSVVEGLIAALPQAGWTAVKITQFGHGICAEAGDLCGCETTPEHPWLVEEETAPSDTDTGRYLAAGARRSFWVRTAEGRLALALPGLRRIFADAANTIVESNSLLQFVRPDVYLVVADPAAADFKSSALRFLDRADAWIVAGNPAAAPWRGVAPRLWDSKPRFRVTPPRYVTAEVAAFVRSRLSSSIPPA
jgi:hypothetical protein